MCSKLNCRQTISSYEYAAISVLSRKPKIVEAQIISHKRTKINSKVTCIKIVPTYPMTHYALRGKNRLQLQLAKNCAMTEDEEP